jgi:hypothetical protein
MKVLIDHHAFSLSLDNFLPAVVMELTVPVRKLFHWFGLDKTMRVKRQSATSRTRQQQNAHIRVRVRAKTFSAKENAIFVYTQRAVLYNIGNRSNQLISLTLEIFV